MCLGKGKMLISARLHHRVLKLSWKNPDLAGEEQLSPHHLAEALQYRLENS
jgi:magnesium chelatase family protein